MEVQHHHHPGRQVKQVFIWAIAVSYSAWNSLLLLGMIVPDIFLLAVGMGRLVELVDLLTGMIKPTEDSLPKRYQIRQPQWFTALGVKNPAGCFSSDFSAWWCSDTELLVSDEWEVIGLPLNGTVLWHISYSTVHTLCQARPLPTSIQLIYLFLIHLLSALHSGGRASGNNSLL